MIEIYFYSFLSVVITFIVGTALYNPIINKDNFTIELPTTVIFGLLFISFLSLIINFFFPLNKITTSIVTLVALPFCFFLLKKNLNRIKFIFYFCAISALLMCLQLSFSNIFRPDAGMYHYPYISILNDNKIIFGLSNIHHRYGLVSVIQYTSAFFNNYLFQNNGIVLPPAILSSSIFIFFFSVIIKKIKNNNFININFFFTFTIFIFMCFKMNRYSEYGNDYLAHFLFFFIIVKFFNEEKNKYYLSDLILLSIFCFLLKMTMFFILFIPLFYFKFYLIKNYFCNYKTYIGLAFLLLWALKNIFITGCLIYPLPSTCIDSLDWSSNKNILMNTMQVKEETEAWSKGFPTYKKYNENKIMDHKEFNANFNWLKYWSEDHFIKIVKSVIPFMLILTIINLIFFFFKKKKKKNYFNVKIIYLISILLCASIYWFINYPLYRFGFSYFISLFALVMAFFFSMNLYNLGNKKSKLFIIIILIISLSFFFLIQLIRIGKTYNKDYYNSPWPNFYLSDNNVQKIIKPIYLKHITIFQSNEECMYGNSLCTHYVILSNLKSSKIFGYKTLYYEKK